MNRMFLIPITIFSCSLITFAQNGITFETKFLPGKEYLEVKQTATIEKSEWTKVDSNSIKNVDSDEWDDAENVDKEELFIEGSEAQNDVSWHMDSSKVVIKYLNGRLEDGKSEMFIQYEEVSPSMWGGLISDGFYIEGFLKNDTVNVTSIPFGLGLSQESKFSFKKTLGYWFSQNRIEGLQLEMFDSISFTQDIDVHIWNQGDKTIEVEKKYHLIGIENGIAALNITGFKKHSSKFKDGSYSSQISISGSCEYDIKNKWIIGKSELMNEENNFFFVNGDSLKILKSTSSFEKTNIKSF